jgi:ribosomal protein S6--L-glutamate ligase
MILSYHPIFVGDENRICAGREPDDGDLWAIKKADAVVLPQGCTNSLYSLVRNNCQHVFPNFDSKFNYPGKTGQIRLFREQQVDHPRTAIYTSISTLRFSADDWIKNRPFAFPFVFKFDWGGEGESVSFIQSEKQYSDALERARVFERSGRKGFLLQEYIPSENRSLRVVVIGQTFISYWRVQKDPTDIRANLAAGAQINLDAEPELQQTAVSSARQFCLQTGINLAGFDFLFSSEKNCRTPLFLEINYFFGRKALGGSEKFYGLLKTEIQKWLMDLKLGQKGKFEPSELN